MHAALLAACSPKGKATLRQYDEALRTIMSKLGLAPPAVKDDAYGDAFLNLVFIPELDENADGQVTRDELLSVQMKAERYVIMASKDASQQALQGWPDLLEAILRGFNRESLVQTAPAAVLSSLDQKMQVRAHVLHVMRYSATVAIGGCTSVAAMQMCCPIMPKGVTSSKRSAFGKKHKKPPRNTYY